MLGWSDAVNPLSVHDALFFFLGCYMYTISLIGQWLADFFLLLHQQWIMINIHASASISWDSVFCTYMYQIKMLFSLFTSLHLLLVGYSFGILQRKTTQYLERERERSAVIRDSVLVIDTVSWLLLMGDSTVFALLMEILSFVASDSGLTFYQGTVVCT